MLEYTLQPTPDEPFAMNGGIAVPVATLRDPFGGIVHIVLSGENYALVTSGKRRSPRIAFEWPDAAISVVKTLPMPSTLWKAHCDHTLSHAIEIADFFHDGRVVTT